MRTKLIIKLLFFIYSIAIIISCEEVITDMELPYSEKLVIRAVLQAGVEVSDVSITKTLPPLEEWSIEKAGISDADARIICDDKEYKLTYYKDTTLPGTDSRYSAPGLIIEAGKIYELIVKWNGLTATAKTAVPNPVTIDSVYHKIYKSGKYGDYQYWDIYIYAVFKPQLNCAYIGGQIHINYGIWYSDVIYKSSDTTKNGKINLNVITYNTNDTLSSMEGKVSYFINAYDKPFYDYFQTRYKGDMSDVIFGMGGKNINGNIEGDGIGLFLGMATAQFKY